MLTRVHIMFVAAVLGSTVAASGLNGARLMAVSPEGILVAPK